MNQTHNSDTKSSEDGQLTVNEILARFEKFSKMQASNSKLQNQTDLSSSNAINKDSESRSYLKRSISHNIENSSIGTTEVAHDDLDRGVNKKPSVPPRSKSFHFLQPRATRRKMNILADTKHNVTMKQVRFKMEDEIIEQDQIYSIPTAATRIDETQDEEAQGFEDIDNPDDTPPIPCTRVKTNQSLTETATEINDAPLKPPRIFNVVARESLDDQVVNDNVENLYLQHRISVNILQQDDLGCPASFDANDGESGNYVNTSIYQNIKNSLGDIKEVTCEGFDSSASYNKKPQVPQRSQSFNHLPPIPTRRETVTPAKEIYSVKNENDEDRYKPNNVPPVSGAKIFECINENVFYASREQPSGSDVLSETKEQEINGAFAKPPNNVNGDLLDDEIIEDDFGKLQPKISMKDLPQRRKSNDSSEANHKILGPIARPRSMLATTETRIYDNELYFGENNRHAIQMSNDALNKISNLSIHNTMSETSSPPPLPPKSLAIKQRISSSVPPSVSGIAAQSDLSAVGQLNEIKSIFSLTSAGQSDKYHKSILLLIDILVEAIQESYNGTEKNAGEIEVNAYYSNIKDFVHTNTNEYIKENQLEKNNLNIPYEKLLNRMLPNLIETCVYTDDNSRQNDQSDEENYESVEAESHNQEEQHINISEKISRIVKELINTETYHLSNLESNFNEYSQQQTPSDIILRLEDILKIQLEFKKDLERRVNDVFWLLKTFWHYKHLFALYVDLVCDQKKIRTDESALPGNVKLTNTDDLSILLLNRLLQYKFFIKNITKLGTLTGEETTVAKEVMEMFNIAIIKCNHDTKELISDNVHNDGLADQTNNSQDAAEILSQLLPASIKLDEYGLFLLKNSFKIDNSRRQFTVFLFKKMIVVTKEESKENLVYKYGLKLDQLVLLPQGKNKKVLKLKDYFRTESSKRDVIVKLEADSEKTEQAWRKEITKCFWEQLEQEKRKKKTK